MSEKVEIKDTHSKEAVALQLAQWLYGLERPKYIKALRIYEECLSVVNGGYAPKE